MAKRALLANHVPLGYLFIILWRTFTHKERNEDETTSKKLG